MATFVISGDYIELNKLLKASGCCGTGGMAKVVIEEGEVKVDGVVELRKRRKLRPGMMVEFRGEQIEVVAES